MNSKFMSWPNTSDALKAAFSAGAGAILVGVYTCLTAVPPHFPHGWAGWEPIAISGAAMAVGSLLRTSFTNSAGQFMQGQSTPAAKAMDAHVASTATPTNQ